jgi:hypothetical protein
VGNMGRPLQLAAAGLLNGRGFLGLVNFWTWTWIPNPPRSFFKSLGGVGVRL